MEGCVAIPVGGSSGPHAENEETVAAVAMRISVLQWCPIERADYRGDEKVRPFRQPG